MKFFKKVRSKRVIKKVLSLLAIALVVITSQTTISEGRILNQHQKTISRTYNINQGRKMRVNATAYCGDTITSTGTKPVEGVTIAVDPTIIPYGTRVYIPTLGKVFIAEDCGSAIKGNRIDIFMNSYSKCMEWGRRNIEIIILD